MKWWRWRVTLPHSPACKAGAFLVCHIPVACRPGAAPDLGGFGDLPAQAGARHVKWCGQPVTLRRLNDGVVASWLLDHGRLKLKGAPSRDTPRHRRSLLLSCGASKPSGLPPSAGLYNKERTPLRALVLVPAGISRRMFRCFRHTSPATICPYFHIEQRPKPSVM